VVHAREAGRIVSKRKNFFFEKKKQKTFAPKPELLNAPAAHARKSFFATFFSKKVVLSYFGETA
jgi:hypothetical protein